MPAITSENVLIAIAKLLAVEAQAPLVGNLRMANLVNRNYENILANGGDTVNVPLPPSLKAKNIAEGGTVQTQNPSLATVPLVLNRHIEASFSIGDVAAALSSVNLRQTYMDPALIALAEQIETDLLNTYSLFTANTAVGGNSPIDEADLDSAETTLFVQKAPPTQQRFLAVSANSYGVLRMIPRFTEMEKIGSGDAITLGNVGRLKNFDIFRSQFVPKVNGINYNLAFTRDAITLAMRRLPAPPPGVGVIVEYLEFGGYGFRMVMSYNPSTFALQVTVHCLYGIAVLRNQFAVVIQSND